jgi:hypothetical protein
MIVDNLQPIVLRCRVSVNRLRRQTGQRPPAGSRSSHCYATVPVRANSKTLHGSFATQKETWNQEHHCFIPVFLQHRLHFLFGCTRQVVVGPSSPMQCPQGGSAQWLCLPAVLYCHFHLLLVGTVHNNTIELLAQIFLEKCSNRLVIHANQQYAVLLNAGLQLIVGKFQVVTTVRLLAPNQSVSSCIEDRQTDVFGMNW